METVLLVDDDRPVLMAGEQTLELAGFTVLACSTAEQALEILGRAHPNVVVTDVRMPGMSGMELLVRIHERDPELPVVLVTGHGDVAMAVRAIRDGAYDFVEKPTPPEMLADVVRRAAERRRLVLENRRLKAELAEAGAQTIIGRTPAIERLRQTIATVADTDADVLLWGETGTGKELVARALHSQCRRREHPFVALNCGAMPETIFESELFGHEAGAFTGAAKRRIGRMEHSSGGTLFLDEIESMPMTLQVKILRALQERAVEPLGSNELVPIDMRVVAATKSDLKQAAAEGRFRQDLYYRLNVVVVTIPPLRDRRDDIPLLFRHFLHLASGRYNREAPGLAPSQMDRLMAHDWPGNVRELRNVADRFVLGLGLLDGADAMDVGGDLSLPERVDLFEKTIMETELARHGGDVAATLQALGIPRKTFYDKLKKHGITRADFEE
ncbi:MAG: sigma-54-dependent Fis family transcriptional regulator [Rhodospirillaceae bacterium]|nr:sigma-54-dependent Fis family transcriptional regulator [Rhodospirillales bacterium]